MPTILITGGNKGLGLESARRLSRLGHTVYIGARDEVRGREAADRIGVRLLVIDVTDDASVAAAAAALTAEVGRLDVLINNAGVIDAMLPAEDVTADDMKAVFDVNVFGVVRVIHAFLPLLQAADHPAIVNVGSGLGSFGLVTDAGRPQSQRAVPVYASSKAAAAMLTVQYAKALPGVRVNAALPGPTATDLTNNQGSQTLQEGTDAIVRLATLGADGPTGLCLDRFGAVPW